MQQQQQHPVPYPGTSSAPVQRVMEREPAVERESLEARGQASLEKERGEASIPTNIQEDYEDIRDDVLTILKEEMKGLMAARGEQNRDMTEEEIKLVMQRTVSIVTKVVEKEKEKILGKVKGILLEDVDKVARKVAGERRG